MNRGIQLGIDSQCLSYVIDAMAGISEPSDSLAVQKLALVRLFFHLPDTLWVTPTVTLECARIRNTDWAALHASFIRVLFGELQSKKNNQSMPVPPTSGVIIPARMTVRFWPRRKMWGITCFSHLTQTSCAISPLTQPGLNCCNQLNTGNVWHFRAAQLQTRYRTVQIRYPQRVGGGGKRTTDSIELTCSGKPSHATHVKH